MLVLLDLVEELDGLLVVVVEAEVLLLDLVVDLVVLMLVVVMLIHLPNPKMEQQILVEVVDLQLIQPHQAQVVPAS